MSLVEDIGVTLRVETETLSTESAYIDGSMAMLLCTHVRSSYHDLSEFVVL
jgi:hypothetical protein